ncbi:HNH endonuclease signature motif containing protein [Streptomyces sparsogenes]|uniref:HNH endonuclease signature motif containing protein n=1 Tax=Streptomyces sparsogenes TaxID=67365 RepID=UPI0033F44059
MAHRFAYETLVGPIPEHLQLDHLCRVRHCVNPDHLEPVSSRENTRRGRSQAGINGRKTHCQKGHPFDSANTYVWKGSRACRTCRSEYARLRRERRAGGDR